MTNNLLFFTVVLLDFFLLLLAYRKLGKAGLFAWIPFATVLANIQVLEVVRLFGMEATLGNAAYATTFLATDILSENYGKKDASRAVFLGFFSLVGMTLLMQVALCFLPSPSDFAHPHLRAIFQRMPRVALASLCAYAVSQFYDIASYHFWKRRLPAVRWLWVRNNLSTLTGQFLDTVLFAGIAFWGIYPRQIFWHIVLTTYLFKAIVALLDTPVLYLARRWFACGKIQEC